MDYTKLPNYSAAVTKYTEAVTNDATETEQKELYANAMNILGTELAETLEESTVEKMNDLMSNQQVSSSISPDVKKFLDEISTDGLGTKEETVLPLEIINEVFVELTYAHPLLDIIKFQSLGLCVKAIVSDGVYNGGNATWGKFTDEITGQLKQSFDEVDFSQSKLTTFVVVPKDALDFGYEWLKTYIVTQISEAMAVALETALVLGTGVNQPVGLIKNAIDNDGITTYKDKDISADLSTVTPDTAAKSLAPLLQKLTINQKGIPINISGQVKLLVNPSDYYTVFANFLKLDLNAQWVDVLPFNVALVPSMAVPQGKGIIFTANRYWAYMGKMTMAEFDQTFALEDLQLYTNKAFYYGRPYDNSTAALVTVAASV